MSRWAFSAAWLDPNSGVQWSYQLFYYPETGEVEMFDIKNRRHFLKRVKPQPELQPSQLYVGSTLTLYSRQLKLTAYGDETTRQALDGRTERTLALIKPEAVPHAGKILHSITQAGFRVAALRMCRLTPDDARQFYAAHVAQPCYPALVACMSSGPVVAMELVAPAAVAKWRALLGPTDAVAARREAPGSIRALFGSDEMRNAAHGSDAPDTAAAELSFFFGTGRGSIGQCAHCSGTLAVIRPHVLKAGSAGLLLDLMLQAQGLEVTALQQFTLAKPEADEFLEVYKGVVPPGEWEAAVEELSAGPCLAVELAAAGGGGSTAEAVEALRELCGPADPELARVLRPDSLRAQFGVSRVRNAIHCTDLPEDGALESGYFFGILARTACA